MSYLCEPNSKAMSPVTSGLGRESYFKSLGPENYSNIQTLKFHMAICRKILFHPYLHF